MEKMRIDILSMCPEQFDAFLKTPPVKRTGEHGSAEVKITDFREYAGGSFRRIDDSPYGGGPGMIIRCQPVLDALEDIRRENSHTVLLSPIGRPFRQADARCFSGLEHLILICGHYEGFDARIYEHVDEIISIGDYILSGGELAAMVIADSVLRLKEGNIRPESTQTESFENGLLEYPQYTRPADYKGQKVPEVLLTGDHEAIRAWRREQSVRLTKRYRPDLLDPS